MKFKNGMLGATIIVIALVTTALFGFVGGIEQESDTQYGYSGNTDVTNLYTYEQVLNYTDYNPTSNWTGYDGDIGFTETADGVTNQYIFRYYHDSKWTTPTLQEDGHWVYNGSGLNYFYLKTETGITYVIKSTIDNPIRYESLDKIITKEAMNQGFNISLSELTNVLIIPKSWEYEYYDGGTQAWSMQEPGQSDMTIRKPLSIDFNPSTQKATIYFDTNGTQFASGFSLSDLKVYWGAEIYNQPYSTTNLLETDSGVQWRISDYDRYGGTADSEYKSWATITGGNEVWYATSVKYHRLFGAELSEFGDDLPSTTAFNLTTLYSPFIVGADDFTPEGELVSFHAESKWVKTAIYNKTTDKWTLTYYDGSVYVGNAYVIYNGNISHNTGMKIEPNVSLYVKPTVTTKYMDITQGMQLIGTDGTGSATWVNGYHTGTVSILISSMAKRNAEYTFTFGQAAPKDAGKGMAIDNYTITNTEDHTVTVSSTTNSSPYYVVTVDGTSYNIGTWKAVLLTIDPQNDRLSVTPVYSVTSFVRYSERSNSTVIDLDLSENYIDWFKIEGTSNDATEGYPNLKFGVVNTSVWEDEYGQLMKNPTIDIASLYPNMVQSGVRLSFTDAAKLGNSMTIGANTFEVDGGYVVTDYGKYELQYITIDLNGEYAQINLGSEYSIIVDGSPTVSFGGSWYFQTYISEYKERTVTYDKWNIGEWGMDKDTTILLFAGLCIAGLVLGMMVYGFRTLDLIVVIGTIIVAISIIG